MIDEQRKKVVPLSGDPPNLLDIAVKDPLRETLNDHFKRGQLLSLQNRPREGAKLKCFTPSQAAQATFDRVMCNLGQL